MMLLAVIKSLLTALAGRVLHGRIRPRGARVHAWMNHRREADSDIPEGDPVLGDHAPAGAHDRHQSDVT
jgi:hypothetical protein